MNKLKCLIVALVVTAGVMVCNSMTMDNDSWYVLAEGREIVENGIYFEDQLSMHEGLAVTVQNYGFAAIFYLIYNAFGPVGIYAGLLILNLVLVFLIYKICMLISDKNMNLSLILAVLTDLLLARWFLVTRAQMVSYVIIMLVIYLLELYIKNKQIKYLWWIPALALLQINLHASLWPMILLVIGTYLFGRGYKKGPLILTALGSFLVGFLNPYGFKMMTFILTSYGVPEANRTIIELNPFDLSDVFSIVLYLVIVGVLILYIFGKNKNIRVRYLLLLFGFLALGLNTVKGMSHLILVLLFPLALMYKDLKIWGSRKIHLMVGSWAGILAVCLILVVAIDRVPKMLDGPNETIIAAIDAIDKEVGEDDKKDLKVYAYFDDGGYVEYRGYKSYIDPRMEVFLKSNNGKEDIFKEWYELENGEIKEADFLAKYDFDYLLVEEGKELYDLENEGYEMIFEDADEKHTRVYKKLRM